MWTYGQSSNHSGEKNDQEMYIKVSRTWWLNPLRNTPCSEHGSAVSVLHINTYSAFKKNETLPSATIWTSLEDIMLNEISQTPKEKYYMISLMYGISKKFHYTERTKQRLPEAGGVERRKWGNVDQKIQSSRDTG